MRAPGSTAAEYFGLLKRLMAPAERRLYLCARGLLGVLSEAIGTERARCGLARRRGWLT